MSEMSGKKSEEVVLSVEGMSCMHCVGRVESGLKETAGILEAKVNLEEKRADITFDPEAISVDAIKAKITEIGYKAS